jgi:hypothetical protein
VLVKILKLVLGMTACEACSVRFSQRRFTGGLLDTTAQQSSMNLGYISLLSVATQIAG